MTTALRRAVLPALILLLLIPHGTSAQSLDDMAKRVAADIATAESAAKEVEATKTTHAGAWSSDSSLASRKSTADAHLAEARLRLKTGQTMRDPLELTRASALASRAVQEYQSLARDIAKLPQSPVATPAPETEEKKPEPRPEPKPKSKPATQTVTQTPPSRVETPKVTGGQPPAELYAAASAYLTGDYKTVIGLLENADFANDQTMAHALLLRSAARYALYYLGGEREAALVKSAGEDAAACKKRDPSVKPLERIFSPRYRQFFEKAGASSSL